MYQINKQEIYDTFRESFGIVSNRTILRISKTGENHLKQYFGNVLLQDRIKEINTVLNVNVNFKEPFAYRTNSGYAAGQSFFYDLGFGVLRIDLYNSGYKLNTFDIYAYPYFVCGYRTPICFSCGVIPPTLEEDISNMLENHLNFLNRRLQIADDSMHTFSKRNV